MGNSDCDSPYQSALDAGSEKRRRTTRSRTLPSARTDCARERERGGEEERERGRGREREREKETECVCERERERWAPRAV